MNLASLFFHPVAKGMWDDAVASLGGVAGCFLAPNFTGAGHACAGAGPPLCLLMSCSFLAPAGLAWVYLGGAGGPWTVAAAAAVAVAAGPAGGGAGGVAAGAAAVVFAGAGWWWWCCWRCWWCCCWSCGLGCCGWHCLWNMEVCLQHTSCQQHNLQLAAVVVVQLGS